MRNEDGAKAGAKRMECVTGADEQTRKSRIFFIDEAVSGQLYFSGLLSD